MFAVKGYEMQKMDQYMMDEVGMPSCVLMENAAKSIVDDLCLRFPLAQYKRRKLTIICGTGNNGGDGLAIGRWLIHLGYDVRIAIVGNKERTSTDHQLQLKMLGQMKDPQRDIQMMWLEEEGPKESFGELKEWIRHSFLIVDGLLGTGCNRTVSLLLKDTIEMLNQYGRKVVSIDMPSGINSDNGKVMGAAVKADTTYTFAMPKIGLILFPGTEYCGELIVKDIGIYEKAQSVIQQKVQVLNHSSIQDAVSQGVFMRKQNTHKGNFGVLGIIAGDATMLGATILAIKAAYRTGVGLVKVFLSEEHASIILSQIPECVIISYNRSTDLTNALSDFCNQVDVITIGPGLSQSSRAQYLVQSVMQMEIKVILDADALNIIAKNMEWFEEKKCQCIITPHIGEMSRLTGYCPSGILENPIHFGAAMVNKYGVITVLKSARTVIATQSEQIYINTLGNPGMSTAGSGDVLVGIIGSLAAQNHTLEDAARYGVLLHATAGDYYALHNHYASLMASDIIECLWKGLTD